MCPNRQPGVQFNVQQELQRAREHAWLLRQRYSRVEVSLHAKTLHTDWPQSPRSLPGHEPRRRVDRDRGRR